MTTWNTVMPIHNLCVFRHFVLLCFDFYFPLLIGSIDDITILNPQMNRLTQKRQESKWENNKLRTKWHVRGKKCHIDRLYVSLVDRNVKINSDSKWNYTCHFIFGSYRMMGAFIKNITHLTANHCYCFRLISHVSAQNLCTLPAERTVVYTLHHIICMAYVWLMPSDFVEFGAETNRSKNPKAQLHNRKFVIVIYAVTERTHTMCSVIQQQQSQRQFLDQWKKYIGIWTIRFNWFIRVCVIFQVFGKLSINHKRITVIISWNSDTS